MESELELTVGQRIVKVRCRMPHSGDKAIWSILVDGTWYGMNLEGSADDTRETIERAAADWLKYDFPNVPKS
jgi:hypothetical protein